MKVQDVLLKAMARDHLVGGSRIIGVTDRTCAVARRLDGMYTGLATGGGEAECEAYSLGTVEKVLGIQGNVLRPEHRHFHEKLPGGASVLS